MEIKKYIYKDKFYCPKYGFIFKCLRIAQDKTLEEMSKNSSHHINYIHKIENGKVNITYPTFLNLCSSYGITEDDFMQIAIDIEQKDLSFQEILFLCSKYESKKTLQHSSITEVERQQKLGLILKAMRISQSKTAKTIANEIGINFVSLSRIETGNVIPKKETLKKCLSFYKISDDDFEVLFKVALKQNLSYPQLLYYCLFLDIGRKQKESKEQTSLDNELTM